jgi:hypothetical protein
VMREGGSHYRVFSSVVAFFRLSSLPFSCRSLYYLPLMDILDRDDCCALVLLFLRT